MNLYSFLSKFFMGFYISTFCLFHNHSTSLSLPEQDLDLSKATLIWPTRYSYSTDTKPILATLRADSQTIVTIWNPDNKVAVMAHTTQMTEKKLAPLLWYSIHKPQGKTQNAQITLLSPHEKNNLEWRQAFMNCGYHPKKIKSVVIEGTGIGIDGHNGQVFRFPFSQIIENQFSLSLEAPLPYQPHSEKFNLVKPKGQN